MKKLTLLAVLGLALLPIACVPVEKETTIIDDDTPAVKKETTIINPPDVKIENNPPK